MFRTPRKRIPAILSPERFQKERCHFDIYSYFPNLIFCFNKGGHSNLGCRDTFLKIVSLLKNYRSEGVKVYIF